MFVSVGSSSNAGENLGPKKTEAVPQWDREHGAIGASWGDETWRADVLAFTPEARIAQFLQRALETVWGLPFTHQRVTFGARPMNEMSSETIWCPTT